MQNLTSPGLLSLGLIVVGSLLLLLAVSDVRGKTISVLIANTKTRWVIGIVGVVLILIGLIGSVREVFFSPTASTNLLSTPTSITILPSSNAIQSTPQLPAHPTPSSYFARVSASEFPFTSTLVILNEGDYVEIAVEGNNPLWNCGIDDISPNGVEDTEKQRTAVSPSANFCSLIGYTQEGLFFSVGAHTAFTATVPGILYLGANDAPPSNCSLPEGCYSDNIGVLVVKVTVKPVK